MTDATQDLFLEKCKADRTLLSIYLVSGIKLHGVITGFDKYSMTLRNNGIDQLVMKHAVATVMPNAPRGNA